jgi:hypothetical protein
MDKGRLYPDLVKVGDGCYDGSGSFEGEVQ